MPVSSFINYISNEKRYSAHTVAAYQKDIEQFLTFSETKELKNISSQNVRQWIINLMQGGVSPRSVNRKITTLNTFFKFLKRESFLENNPMQKISLLKTKKQLPQFIPEQNMEQLFELIEFGDDFEGIRARLILETFYATGMRRSELINLQTSDINFYNCELKVLGKRNKERIIPFSTSLKSLFRLYINVKEKKFADVKVDEYLFLNNKGKKMGEKFVYKIVNAYLSQVTTLTKRSPHVIRHSFATHMLNRGADLNAIKEILGHANLSATQVYTHNTFEQLKKIHEQAHPRA